MEWSQEKETHSPLHPAAFLVLLPANGPRPDGPRLKPAASPVFNSMDRVWGNQLSHHLSLFRRDSCQKLLPAPFQLNTSQSVIISPQKIDDQ